MNYLAHALPFLENPYFAAGTGVPDWLTVADRSVRVRPVSAAAIAGDADPVAAAVAGGALQHLCDDARFHATPAFMAASLELTVLARDALGADAGFRPSFLGHLLVEVLLDAALAAEQPGRLAAYYRALDAVDPEQVQAVVNRMATRPTDRLAAMISQFRRHRILWDYLEDGKLLVRLNQVMARVGFESLPDGFAGLLPTARRLVAERRTELMEGIPAAR